MMKKEVKQKILVALGLSALSLVMGGFVAAFQIPLYLDTVGTVIATITLGWRYGIISALTTAGAGFFFITSNWPLYAGTAIAIVLVVEILYRYKLFNRFFLVIISGMIVAFISAIISAPVTTLLLGGHTLSGADAITSFLMATGESLWQAVLFGGFVIELFDKVIVCVIAFYTIKHLPSRLVVPLKLRPIPNNG